MFFFKLPVRALLFTLVLTSLLFQGCSKSNNDFVVPRDDKENLNEINAAANPALRSPFQFGFNKQFVFSPTGGFKVNPLRSATTVEPAPVQNLSGDITISFVSYEVETIDSLQSGIITFDLTVSTQGDPVFYPAVVFKFNDKTAGPEPYDSHLRHYLINKDFYIPEDINNLVSNNNLPLQAGFLVVDPETGIPAYEPLLPGIPKTRRFQIKVYPEREHENGDPIHLYEYDNYPVDTWEISLICADTLGLGLQVLCNKIPLDIMNQSFEGPFSGTHSGRLSFNVAPFKYNQNEPFIAKTCLSPQSRIYYSDTFEYGTFHFEGFDYSISNSTDLKPVDDLPYGPGLETIELLNPPDGAPGTYRLSSGVHHLLVEARVFFEGPGGIIEFYIYDDVEVLVSPENITNYNLDGYYDVFYLSTGPSDHLGIYRSRVVIPESNYPVNNYSTPLHHDYLDLASWLNDPIAEVVSLSCSPDGRFLTVCAKLDSEDPANGYGKDYSVYVLDIGEKGNHFFTPSVMHDTFGKQRLDANYWFVQGDIDDSSGTEPMKVVKEMYPQISQSDESGYFHYVVFEALIRERLGIGGYRDYKRVFWSQIDVNNGTFTTPLELRWPFIESRVGPSGTAADRKGYNTLQPSIGGPVQENNGTIQEIAFMNSNGTIYKSAFVVSYTSTLSFNDNIPNVNSITPGHISFNKGESHINLAFLSGLDVQAEDIHYGMYWDEGNDSNTLFNLDHYGVSCHTSQVSNDGRVITYLGQDGSYNLPYYNFIAKGPEGEDPSTFNYDYSSDTLQLTFDYIDYYLITNSCTGVHSSHLPYDGESNFSRS